jgi:hypothetical protein
MSIIFPGNYVANLNAYREQGVVALPGVEFYRAVGALVLNPDNDSVTDAGTLAAGTYDLQILSPDLRQDDKPRKDKALVIPTGSVVYRTAVSAPGVKAETAGKTVVIAPSGSAGFPTTPSLAAGSDTYYDADGVSSALDNILGGTATTGNVQVQVTTNGSNTAGGAKYDSPSAIIVEVCYYRAAPAPSTEDVSIPYAVEAGQGY